MIEPLLERVRELEKANRRWKSLCAILTVILLAVLIPGTAFVGYFTLTHHRRATQAMEEARMMELMAREQAVEAQRRAEQAVQEAQQQKKD